MWGLPTAACGPSSSGSEWASPLARDAKGCTNASRKSQVLPDMVREWATPTIKWNYAKARLSQKAGDGLATQTKAAAWPTPSASSYGSNQGGAAGREGPVRPSLNTLGREAPGSCLSAEWVEALMGFPPGWTSPPASPPAAVKPRRAGSRSGR